jgi:hypothetical protein
MSQDAVDAAAFFATGAGRVITIIGDAVEGFVKLSDFGGIMVNHIEALTFAVSNTIAAFANYGRFMDQEAVAAATAFADGAGKVVGIIGGAVEAFKKLGEFQGASSGIIQAFSDGLQALLTELQNRTLPAATDMGTKIAQGIIAGFQSQVPAITSALVAAVQQAMTAAKAALGIASPSKLMAEQIGMPLAQGIAQGVNAGAPLVGAALQGAATSYTYNITYTNAPSSGSISSDIRLLTMLGAGAM